MHLSQCWSQARIFVTVFPVHLLNSAYTWQIQQHRTLINVNTGYVNCTLHLWERFKHVVTMFSRRVTKSESLPNHSESGTIGNSRGCCGDASRPLTGATAYGIYLLLFRSSVVYRRPVEGQLCNLWWPHLPLPGRRTTNVYLRSRPSQCPDNGRGKKVSVQKWHKHILVASSSWCRCWLKAGASINWQAGMHATCVTHTLLFMASLLWNQSGSERKIQI